MSDLPKPKPAVIEQIGPFLPEIRRARYDRLTIYEVEESELTILERGSPDSIYLSFAIALLSAALSFTAALASATVQSDRTYTVMVVITVVGYVTGTVLAALWWRSRASVRACVATIRNRLVPEWLPDTAATDPQSEAEPGHALDAQKDARQ